nr:endoglucanase 24-like [Tanacetum cinerariifolium]
MMPPGELRNALIAVRWSTDYLLKTVAHPDRIIVQTYIPCAQVLKVCLLYESTTETTSTNNVSGLYVSSLSDRVPGEVSTKSATSIDNVNVVTVSFSDHYVSHANLTEVYEAQKSSKAKSSSTRITLMVNQLLPLELTPRYKNNATSVESERQMYRMRFGGDEDTWGESTRVNESHNNNGTGSSVKNTQEDIKLQALIV